MVVLGSDSGESVQLQGLPELCRQSAFFTGNNVFFSGLPWGSYLIKKKNVEWKKGNQKESRMGVRNTTDVRH